MCTSILRYIKTRWTQKAMIEAISCRQSSVLCQSTCFIWNLYVCTQINILKRAFWRSTGEVYDLLYVANFHRKLSLQQPLLGLLLLFYCIYFLLISRFSSRWFHPSDINYFELMAQIHSINKMSYNNKITTNYIHKMGKKRHALGRSIQVKVAVDCCIECHNRQHTYTQITQHKEST